MVSIYILIIACLLAWILAHNSKLPLTRKGVYQGLIIFGNQGFLGYAVCYSLFSKEGAMYTAIFNIPFLLLIWTYGIYLVAKNKTSFSWQMLFLNPGIMATFCKLIIVPAFLFPLVLWYPKPVLLTIAILVTAMPCVPTTPLFAQKYGCDAYFGSIRVCLSTILTLLSLFYLLVPSSH